MELPLQNSGSRFGSVAQIAGLAAADIGFAARLETLVTRELLQRHAITGLFRSPGLKSPIEQILLDFCEFNTHAASNVLRLSAELMDNATHSAHNSLRAFGRHTSAISALVLRAAADDELGTASHDFMDPHDVLMAFTISILKVCKSTISTQSYSHEALRESDTLYRGFAISGSQREKFCYRLGVHLASEYSASEEFAAITRLLHVQFPALESKLISTEHPQFDEVTAMTWIACHEEVEIGHARYALRACELALACAAEEMHATADLKAIMQRGFEDFYRLRRTFFETLLG